MTTPQNIIELVKELQADWNAFEENGLPEDELIELEAATCNAFPAIAESLLIAYEPLRNHYHLVRGECLESCDICKALQRIHSLPLQ